MSSDYVGEVTVSGVDGAVVFIGPGRFFIAPLAGPLNGPQRRDTARRGISDRRLRTRALRAERRLARRTRRNGGIPPGWSWLGSTELTDPTVDEGPTLLCW